MELHEHLNHELKKTQSGCVCPAALALLGGITLERLFCCFFAENPEMDTGIEKKHFCQNEKDA